MRLDGSIMHQFNNTTIGPVKLPCTPTTLPGKTTLLGTNDDGTNLCATTDTNFYALVPINESAFMVWQRSNSNSDGKGFAYRGGL
jgi:hypothetical protein